MTDKDDRTAALLEVYEIFYNMTMEEHASAFAMLVKSGRDRGLPYSAFHKSLEGFENHELAKKTGLN